MKLAPNARGSTRKDAHQRENRPAPPGLSPDAYRLARSRDQAAAAPAGDRNGAITDRARATYSAFSPTGAT